MLRSRRWARALIGCGLASLAATACTGADDDASTRPPVMVALDAVTGQPEWSVERRGTDDTFFAATGEKLVVGSRGGDNPRVEAYDIETGDRRWYAPVLGWVADSTRDSKTGDVDPAASGVVVVSSVTPTEQVIGLDATTGRRRWTIGKPERFLGVSDTLVFTSRPDAEPRHTLNAFDRRTGTAAWSFPVTRETGHTDNRVVDANRDVVVVASGPLSDGAAPSPLGPTRFLVLDARSGAERSRFQADSPAMTFSDFVIHDGAIIYANGADVLARDLGDGSVRWRHRTSAPPPGPSISGAPWAEVQDVGEVDVVFTGDERGFSALDRSTGAIRWSSPSPDVVNAATRDSVVVLRGDRITALATADGKPRWNRSRTEFLRASSFDELGIEARARHVILAVHPPSN